MRTRIKIDGIMRAIDAKAAADAGVDAVGFILHPASPRNVSIETAREILDVLPAFVTPLAVFVDADSATILKTVQELRLRHVQLHGRESPKQVAELRGLRIIKAIRVDANFRDEIAKWREANLVGIVLETGGTKEHGGTGVANDWDAIRRFRDEGIFNSLPPIIAAGGLTAASVSEVVRTIRPYAVDVSSGVESSRGVKSREKIAEFVAAVRAADGD